MKMLKGILLLFSLLLTTLFVRAQNDQSGFISIDCGIVKGLNYSDKITTINYVSDADFIDSGEIHSILPIYQSPDPQLTTLTSFPENDRNCYTLRPTKGKGYKYLIRARFMYGNYDFKNQLPEFDVYLGPDYWDTLKFNSSTTPVNMEIIHMSSSDYIHVCLLNTGRGTPFISAIELRLLGSNMYTQTDFGSLYLFKYADFGAVFGNTRITQPPSRVMSTAITPTYPTDTFNIEWNERSHGDKFFVYLHFAEIETLKINQKREFNIYLNGNLTFGPISPLNHSTTTVYSTEPEIVAPTYTLTINKTKNSTLPPIVNALELYTLKQLPQKQTYDQDAAALWSIKSTYRLTKNWQGDPCTPQEFAWNGLRCSSDDKDSPRITFFFDGDSTEDAASTGLHIRKQQYTYSEVQSITNNFNVVIGKGGFGTVYHGHIGGTQVAVKMLSESSHQGEKEFQAEANLLLSVHHKNLTSFVGYCNDEKHKGIIYEYMANGNLEKLLFDTSSSILDWEERLQIGCDAAHGLEYLHHGCKPPIVHRDIKCTNILLNGTLQAKLADFGLSRAFPTEGGTHISTKVAGTPGYLDPEYYILNRLTEKSDVYSFGVVLLVIITGQPAVTKYENENIHLSQWVSLKVSEGNLKNIVDPRIPDDFDINSAWKAIEVAMTCVADTPSRRPTMNEMVMELNDCLAAERARKETESGNLTGLVSLDLDSVYDPNPR
ncbi:hypothetical protein L1987_87354 [Smallanthus sonchifolius]|nr:hypothetical protein L1987_87354 [Smallanthus sonchifolius]